MPTKPKKLTKKEKYELEKINFKPYYKPFNETYVALFLGPGCAILTRKEDMYLTQEEWHQRFIDRLHNGGAKNALRIACQLYEIVQSDNKGDAII